MLIKKKRKVDSFNLFNPFSTNVPLMHKPGSWFLLGRNVLINGATLKIS